VIEFEPAEQSFLVLAVERMRTKVGAIEVIESQPCGTGKVIKRNSQKHQDVKVGDTIYFRMDSVNPIRLENGLMHGLIHESNVLGWTHAEHAEGPAKHVGSVDPAKALHLTTPN